jgi:tetratricopeptide (TPR) repeat protein
MGQATYRRGDYRRAMQLFRLCIDSLHGDSLRERFGLPFLPSVQARVWLAGALAEAGVFREADAVAEEAVRLAGEADHPFSQITACFGSGMVALLSGQPSVAVPVLERGVALCSSWEISIWFPALASLLGLAYARSGRCAQAVTLLEEAIQEASSRGITWSESAATAGLGETHLLAGRIPDAVRWAERAFNLTTRYKEDAARAHVLHLLGGIAGHSDAGNAATAQRRYRESMALATKLGMRPLVAHCHLGLGNLYRQTGKREQAQEHLTIATTMYREMAMRFWLEQAEGEMRALA